MIRKDKSIIFLQNLIIFYQISFRISWEDDDSWDMDEEFSKSDGEDEKDEVENDKDELDIDLEPGFQWGAHNQLLHSYIISNSVLLCNQCIEEKKLSPEKYKPIK